MIRIQPTTIVAMLLGLPAFLSAGLWMVALLFPHAGLTLGDRDRAMGWVYESPDPGSFRIYWGNAIQQGFEVDVWDGGVGFSHSWNWKKTNRQFPFDEASPPTQPDHDYNWNLFNLVRYGRFHLPEAYDEDDIWHSGVGIRHSLLTGVTSGVFGCYMLALFIRSIVIKRRKRLGGFPVIHPPTPTRL